MGFPDASEMMEGELLEALMQQAVLAADDALSGPAFQALFRENMQPGLKPKGAAAATGAEPASNGNNLASVAEVPPSNAEAAGIGGEAAAQAFAGTRLPVRGMEQAALELQALKEYTVEANTIVQQGFAGVNPSIHSMLLWQETTVRSLQQRLAALNNALQQGLKTSDQAWPKRVRVLLEKEESKFRLRRFPEFIDAVVKLCVAAQKGRDERLASTSSGPESTAPRLLTVAASEGAKRRVSLISRIKAAGKAFAAPTGPSGGGFVDEQAALELAKEVSDPLSVDRLMGVAEALGDPSLWVESTAELRRELLRKRQLCREARSQVRLMRDEADVASSNGDGDGFEGGGDASDNDGDENSLPPPEDRRTSGVSSYTARESSAPSMSSRPQENGNGGQAEVELSSPRLRDVSDTDTTFRGAAPGGSTTVAAKDAAEFDADLNAIRKLLHGRVSPFLNTGALTTLLGKQDYARLVQLRRAYLAKFESDMRADIKRKKTTNTKYGKLTRHFTLSRSEWAFKAFKTAQDASSKQVRFQEELQAVEALCLLDKAGMKDLQERFERDRKMRPLFDEVGNRWLANTHGGEKVRALLLAVCRLRLGVGGLPSTAPKDAQLQGEALAELLVRDDPVGLEALCRQLCGNRSREHLALVREGFMARSKTQWLDNHGECRVLAPLRGEPLLHATLSLLFNEPPVHFVSRLYRSFSMGGGAHGAVRSAQSLKATWQLDGSQTTEELTYLVTVCKDAELAAVNQLLDLAPFHMSLGTLVLSVPDAETRKLLAQITQTATQNLKKKPLSPAIAKLLATAGAAPPPSPPAGSRAVYDPPALNRQFTGDI